MTLQGHYCSLITLGFVCVSPPTRVSLLLCVWVCARVCVCVREVIMQMTVDVPARHNVDTSTPLATCACVFTHTHAFHPSEWPVALQLHNSLRSGKTGSEDGWQWLSLWPFLLHFICLRGRPRTQGMKILKYWMKGKECCQTLYLSCLMERSLFVCLTVSLFYEVVFELWMCSLVISHSFFCRKEVSLSFRFRWLTSKAWEVSYECAEFQSGVINWNIFKRMCADSSRCVTQSSELRVFQLWPPLALQTFRRLPLSEMVEFSNSGVVCITDSFFKKVMKIPTTV